VGRWLDLPAVWRQSADNFGDGDYTPGEPADRMLAVQGLVLHIAQGSGPGTVSWCANPSSDVGPHFVAAEDGTITQMVDTGDYSWCQAAGNRYWLSVECAGWSGNPLTAAQVESVARILARAHQVYRVPLQATDSPDGRGLGWHGMGGAAWGGHTNCPGQPVLKQRPEIIARAKQLVGGDDDLQQDERAWLARCVEILAAMATGNPEMWTKQRVRAQEQLNAVAEQVPALLAEVRALTAAFRAIAEGGTSVDTAAVLASIRDVRQLVEREHAAELAAARAEVKARTADEAGP
jgi:hypothetical protein